MAASDMKISREELGRHDSQNSCWIVIHGFVYDVTEFLEHHPGGKSIILKEAGRDATETFESVHSVDILDKHLKASQRIGPIANHTVSTEKKMSSGQDASLLHRRLLSQIINISDFEVAAAKVMNPKYYVFFKTGADSEISVNWNQKSWKAIRFRPRVLTPVVDIDISTTILGTQFSAPFFIAPAGGGKFANRQGEVLMTRAAAKHDILQWVCNNAGCTQKQMADARGPNQTLYWQIYAMENLEITKKEVQQAVKLGYKGFALTVDAIKVGKRERDMRINISEAGMGANEDEVSIAGSISSTRPSCYAEFDFVGAVKWLRSITDLPIAIKGIQCWEDAVLCMKHDVHPWLSNHGGRQLEGAPSAADTLVEIRQNCPEVFDRCEVIVDGGITRGTDIVKALALGAKGVALGRGFLYALVFGEIGVSKAIHILKQEVETAMGLLGVTSIDQLRPSHVDVSGLSYAGAVVRANL